MSMMTAQIITLSLGFEFFFLSNLLTVKSSYYYYNNTGICFFYNFMLFSFKLLTSWLLCKILNTR